MGYAMSGNAWILEVHCISLENHDNVSRRMDVENVNNLVDPASSHMLVSEIKPCMSKYIPLNGETANGSLNQLWFLRSYLLHG